MRLDTNLATRPFYNERAAQAIIVGLLALVALASVTSVVSVASLTGRERALAAEAAAAESRAGALRRQVAGARSGLGGERLNSVAAAVREVNAIIDGRTFSWTALFNWLETMLPPDVRIIAIKPRVEPDGRFILGITVEAHSVAAIDTFLTQLEGTGRFEDLLVRQERETEAGTIEATAEGRYTREGGDGGTR